MINKKYFAIPVAMILSLPALGNTGHQEADNTGKNKRDMQQKTLTPVDQMKGSATDVEITRRIRESIVKDDSLSMDAHNVKIITVRGVSTLRGPVDSASEKAKIVSMAQQVAGSASVRDQLEVKAKN